MKPSKLVAIKAWNWMFVFILYGVELFYPVEKQAK